MKTGTTCSLLLASALGAVSGCYDTGARREGDAGRTDTTSRPGIVDISVTAASLGEGCPVGSTGLAPGVCPMPIPPPQDAGATAEAGVGGARRPDSGTSGDSESPCWAVFNQTCGASASLSIVRRDAEWTAVSVAVSGARLYHEGRQVGTLSASALTVWTGSSFVAWGGRVGAGESLNVRVPLSSPDWRAVDRAMDPSDTRLDETYVARFRLELDVVVDGVTVTLSYEPVMRQPILAT